MDDFDIEEQLTQDLEYIKTYLSVDILFQFYLKEIFEKEKLYCITYSDKNKVVKHDRNKRQYICHLYEVKKTKRFLWIPIKITIRNQYVILAELNWDQENDRKLGLVVDGYNAYHRLIRLTKQWAIDNEVFFEFSIRTPDDNQFHCQTKWEKYIWQKDFKRIDGGDA